jgi:hypothetical protein
MLDDRRYEALRAPKRPNAAHQGRRQRAISAMPIGIHHTLPNAAPGDISPKLQHPAPSQTVVPSVINNDRRPTFVHTPQV